MDPEATLLLAEDCVNENELEHAESCLSDYWGWRARGGFEPESGDARARGLMADIRGMKVARATKMAV